MDAREKSLAQQYRRIDDLLVKLFRFSTPIKLSFHGELTK